MEYRYKFREIRKNIPKSYKNAKMSEVDEETKKRMDEMVIQKIRSFRSFYLYGDTGVGKTYTAFAVANLFIEIDIPMVVVIKNTVIIRAIKNSFNFYRNAEDPRAEDIQDDIDFLEDLQRFTGMLIIDDIGSTEKDSEAVLDRYFEIIDERCENKRLISFTSNLSPNELVLKMGKRTVDRMMMNCDPIKLIGINRRLQ